MSQSCSVVSLPMNGVVMEAHEGSGFASSYDQKDPSSQHDWQKSMEAAIPAIVVIRVCAVRPFDGQGANFSYATGFVVDKEQGIILTNRHVVTAGPVTADAVFLNKEEIDLVPIYRDPVHDFGFCRFDPSKLKYLAPTEIALDPDGAKVGREIRVVGNDNGEKLSILPGILARIDREAPFYGSNDYNDWNTFYYGAASSNSGGSSGSPVLTIEGRAIALNCGAAKKAASSFYLPLHRIKRALELLQAGEPVPRGTLQTIFKHKAFDEVRRLGLPPEVEGRVRRECPDETGMLVVDQVIPKGPADGILEPGDILLEVDSSICTTFLPLEVTLDSLVGLDVNLKIQRGGSERDVRIRVQDLHQIIPTDFLEISSGVVHPLSYQQAKNYNLPVGGVYMAASGYMFTRAGMNVHCIITSVGGQPTPDLDAFQSIMETFPDGTRTSIQYFALNDRNRIRTGIITVDRRWFRMSRCTRKDPVWVSIDAKPPPTPPPPVIESNRRKRVRMTSECSENSVEAGVGDDRGSLADALVMVSFDIPYLVDGISGGEYVGTGIIFDKENGLVLVDRSTVPIALGDVIITVGGTLEIPGEVVLVHPVHNFSVVRYNPAELLAQSYEHPVTEAIFAPPECRLRVGDAATFYGLTTPFIPVFQHAVVTKTEVLKLTDGRPPQFIASNTEVLFFDRIASCAGGVFQAEDGKVAALWLCFAFQSEGEVKQVYRGLPVDVVYETVQALKGVHTVPSTIRAIPIKLTTVQLAKARAGMGLPEDWAQELQDKCRKMKSDCSLLTVRRIAARSPAEKVLKTGDVLLSVDGSCVTRPIEVQELTTCKNEVELAVLRNHEIVRFKVATSPLDTFGTSRLVLWSGLMLQEPHLPVRSLGYVPEEGGGVYISRWSYGSPAQKYGLRATNWIVQVNDQPTPDLDTFIKVISANKDHSAIRLKTRDLDAKIKVFTLRGDYQYWPMLEVKWDREQRKWRLHDYKLGVSTPPPEAL